MKHGLAHGRGGEGGDGPGGKRLQVVGGHGIFCWELIPGPDGCGGRHVNCGSPLLQWLFAEFASVSSTPSFTFSPSITSTFYISSHHTLEAADEDKMHYCDLVFLTRFGTGPSLK